MTTVCITLPDLSDNEALQVASDAIYEYRARREPAHDYVQWRYKPQGTKFRADKLESVLRRLKSVNESHIDTTPLADQAVEPYIRAYGYWGECPTYPVQDWQGEIANGDTRKGYWEWVAAQENDR